MEMRIIQETSDSSKDLSSVLLITYVLIEFLLTTSNAIFMKLVPNFYTSSWKYLIGASWLLSNMALILPALAIKNKTFKTIALILAIIVFIYRGYDNINFMFRT